MFKLFEWKEAVKNDKDWLEEKILKFDSFSFQPDFLHFNTLRNLQYLEYMFQ